MFILIGIGLSIDSISLAALKTLCLCDVLVYDSYTNTYFPSIDKVAEIIGKVLGIPVIKACRRDLEEKSRDLIAKAENSNVCLIVSGDPLIATTHISILNEASRRGIEIVFVPGISIHSVAVSLSGLQVYRFGKVVTLVLPKNGILYEYPLQVIEENRSRNLHTLLLLEIDIEKGIYMTPCDAAKLIVETQRRLGKEIIDLDDKIIVLQAIGSSYSRIHVTTLRELLSDKCLDIYRYPPYTMIIPSRKLHPEEEEALSTIQRIKLSVKDSLISVVPRILEALCRA